MTTQTFTIQRDQDVSGISGTGHVADGVTFEDGTTVVRWLDLGGPAAERGVRPTTVIFPTLEAVEALHGHGGATRLVMGSATSTCKHCGRTIGTPLQPHGSWIHADGGHRHKNRCNPEDSQLIYGYNACPEGEKCSLGCLGSTEADAH